MARNAYLSGLKEIVTETENVFAGEAAASPHGSPVGTV
jgi:hypothetical protein